MSILEKRSIEFSKAKVLIIGDLMLDRYWHGSTSRISPEAPVPIVHVKKTEERPGGAGNVALNIRALDASVDLIGVVGDDSPGKTLVSRLEAAEIRCHLQKLHDKPTITKLRVISRHQQLIRLDFEEEFAHPNQDQLNTSYQQLLANVDTVILSDYGKGTLNNPRELIAMANKAGKPVFIDPKSLDFADYHGAACITPNINEFEAVVGHCRDEADIIDKANALIKQHDIAAILITRGEQGMTLIQRDQSEVHIPTQAKEVFDVTGAGDTVIATLATSVANGFSLVDAMKIANTAAGIVVGKLGAATASAPEIRRALNRKQVNASGVLNQEQLLLATAEAKAHGEKIVMTNGCFDILHAGHVHYLKQAKALGQRLIIAVNTDESVRKLKGDGRPINSLEKRMAVLSGLSSVDWVIPFSEDTPERLIADILPDVLVKGGDYQAEQVAGYDDVMSNGGEVKILDFIEGLSTSNVVKKIIENA